MRGSTRKRANTWTAYWDLSADMQSGGRRQKSKGGFRTQKEAQRHLASVVVAVGEGTYVEPSRQPLARFLLDEWLPGISSTVRPRAQLLSSTARSRAQRPWTRATAGRLSIRLQWPSPGAIRANPKVESRA